MARDRASRPEAKALRLFVAVDIPDPIRRGLDDAIAPLREGIRARWVPSRNWHVTMKFLGSTYPRLVDWVMREVESVVARHAPIETSLTELGAFPNARRARVLWAGLENPGGTFGLIARDLDEALAREFKIEKRDFTAHLTVARFDPPVPLEVEDVALPNERFTVDSLVVYRSHLGRPAPRYEPTGEFELRGR